MHLAVDKGHLEVVQGLLKIDGIAKDAKADPPRDRTAYQQAAYYKNIFFGSNQQKYQAIMEELKKLGADTTPYK